MQHSGPREYRTSISGERIHAKCSQECHRFTIIYAYGDQNYFASQHDAGLKLHSDAKGGIVFGHDNSWSCWYFCHSSQITFESLAKLINIVGELKAVNMSDEEEMEITAMMVHEDIHQ